MIHGVINIYKERGYTSHDVVAKLRGILKQKKIGHTGTLDPEAEGVLPVCLGAGTKLCDLLTEKEKTYRAVLLLGCETDTQDTTGTVLQMHPVEASEAEVREVVSAFVGPYDQIPPMYSALKVNGKKLYELAREGKTVERTARRVEIREIVIEEIDLPRVTMTVTCSKGTYIRTLCHDIGQRLGCGGCMEQLTRTRVSQFDIQHALKLADVESLRDGGGLSDYIYSVDSVLAQYPACRVTKEAERFLLNGNPLLALQLEGLPGQEEKIRVYDSGGRFCAVYRRRAEDGVFVPVKMFLECRENQDN